MDDLVRDVREARAALASRPQASDAGERAAALYLAQRRLDRRDRDVGQVERAATMAAIDGVRRVPGPGRERAALVALDVALRGTDTEAARSLLDEHGEDIATETGLAEWAAARIEVLRQEGRTAEALAALDEAALLLGESYVSVVEADLTSRLETPPLESRTGVAGAQARTSEATYETALLEPYPNPATSRVTVPMTLAASAEVEVAVFDVLGRRVSVLAQGPREAGAHELVFEPSRLSTGTYIVRMVVDGDAAYVSQLTVVR